MISTFHSQYPLLHIDLTLDQDHQPTPFTLKAIEGASSSSHNLLYPPIIIKPNQDGGSPYCQGLNYPFQNQEEANKNASLDVTRDPTVLKQGNYGRIPLSIGKKGDGVKGNREINEDTCSTKLMSTKIRMMRKMVCSDQTVSDVWEDHKDLPTPPIQKDDHNNNNSVRVCSDCSTTKTPVWRGGPRGPKSLCNACGIRQRKARLAMAAAAGENGTVLAAKINASAALKTKVQKKVKKASDSHLPFKKRCKFPTSRRGRKKLSCFEDLSIILSKNSTYQQVFPQDEKEAAILLLALSYGLVQG